MKPRHILYIIWIAITLMGVICLVAPKGGFAIGKFTLRWPTLSEILESSNRTSNHFTYTDTTWIAAIEDYSISENIEEGFFSTIEPKKREIQPLQPKYQFLDEESEPLIDAEEELEENFTATKETKESAGPLLENSSKPTITSQQESTGKSDTQSTQKTGIDSRKYLTAFYQSLDSASVMPIRVVHYGDSQIEEDRITDILREQWQKRFGGGGVGLLPLHQTVPTRSIRQWLTINGVKQTAKGGPMRYLIYGPRSKRQNNNDYGMMGQVAVMDTTLVAGSQQIVMHIEPASKKGQSYRYFNQIRLFTDRVIGQVVVQNSPIAPSAYNRNIFHLPDSTTRCTINFQGKGKVYGISLETNRGVMVDNIPMRGCSGTIFTQMNGANLADYFHSTNTRLIILQYGGNTVPHSKSTASINSYVKNLRKQIRYIRACAPHASILFVGPSDMSTRIEGKMTTYPMIPYLDQQLKLMAEEEHIAYWSMYEAMGGHNSMVNWVERGLAGGDYVHFTRAGANKVGKMLDAWIMGGR